MKLGFLPRLLDLLGSFELQLIVVIKLLSTIINRTYKLDIATMILFSAAKKALPMVFLN